MKGAIVFLLVFALLIVLTIVNVTIPPGQAIYNAILPGTEAAASYLIAGVSSVTVIISVFNGVIYGIIAWVVFSVIMMATKKDKKERVNVNVTVNNSPGNTPPPQSQMTNTNKLVIIPGATHLFEEPGKLEEVAKFAADWFTKYLK